MTWKVIIEYDSHKNISSYSNEECKQKQVAYLWCAFTFLFLQVFKLYR